jgi:leucine dehydrogenase
MPLFERMREMRHEQVVFCHEESCGLRAIIAVHDTTLGPALGGVRLWNYASEEEALVDCLRLARGMTYKAAVAGLNLGGGKAVIIADAKKDKSEALFRAFGRFVESLGGRYITAEDVNTGVDDMEFVAAETKHVTGVSTWRGGSGDPSPTTSYGVYIGIKACVLFQLGRKDLSGLTVAIQGLGKVGFNLAGHLTKEKARVVACDIDKDRAARAAEELGVEIVPQEQLFELPCEVFAPCALGGVINDQTVGKLRCKIVAGGANNQLAEERHGHELERRGILYAPDFAINSGGLINVYCEIGHNYNHQRALRMAEGIGATLLKVFEVARAEKIPTYAAAERIAERRIEGIRRMRV